MNATEQRRQELAARRERRRRPPQKGTPTEPKMSSKRFRKWALEHASFLDAKTRAGIIADMPEAELRAYAETLSDINAIELAMSRVELMLRVLKKEELPPLPKGYTMRQFLRALPIELDYRVKDNSLLIAPKAKRA